MENVNVIVITSDGSSLNLCPGDRIVIPKSNVQLIQHHAIYLGYSNGNYWVIENKIGNGVQITPVPIFLSGVNKITRVERFNPSWFYSRNDLIKYALSKVGTPYHIINNNCEHFSNEIQHRISKSSQAQTAIGLGAMGLGILAFVALIND